MNVRLAAHLKRVLNASVDQRGSCGVVREVDAHSFIRSIVGDFDDASQIARLRGRAA
jgi:hypothetical protein